MRPNDFDWLTYKFIEIYKGCTDMKRLKDLECDCGTNATEYVEYDDTLKASKPFPCPQCNKSMTEKFNVIPLLNPKKGTWNQ